MKVVECILTTTHVDTQGESPTKSALEKMASVLNRTYLPMQMHHDPRIPPIGRVRTAQVRSLEDGEYALWGEVEVWEDGDTFESLKGDGRSIKRHAPREPEVWLDLGLMTPDRVAALEEALDGVGELKYRPKKAADRGTSIVLAMGLYTLAQLASGFLGAAGRDLYARIKPHLFAGGNSDQALKALEVAVLVEAEGREVEVLCFLPDPTPTNINSFVKKGLDELPSLVITLLESEPGAARLFFQWEEGRWHLHYWVRDDGVPSRIEPVAINSLKRMGLSYSGTVSIRPDP